MKLNRIICFIFELCFFNLIIAKELNTLSPAVCYHTNNNSREARIVGGANAGQTEFPFMISLKFRGGHLCGGSILNEKWVITAAHCLCNGLNEQINIVLIKGIAGSHKLSDSNSIHLGADQEFSSHSEISFKRAVVHPNYKCTRSLSDLALLEVERTFEFNNRIKPVCLPSYEKREELYVNSVATVVGWGWTNEDRSKGQLSDVLQKADVIVWKNNVCQNSFVDRRKKNSILETQLCAGYESGGTDSCWADSGGPLLWENKLIGIVSTGIGCARPGLPGIYTRVNKYFDWISSVIN